MSNTTSTTAALAATTTTNPDVAASNVELLREKKMTLPTLAQMRDPSLIPADIVAQLTSTTQPIGLHDHHPLNLFRISWKNDPVTGGHRKLPNHLELPSSLTGVPCRLVLLVGKHFPTGAHKIGATYVSLVDNLTRGTFDPRRHKALWPSTGNYCRGGAFNSSLLGCRAVAVLPENMSRERFRWLEDVGAEIVATPGCESNVKEIFDKVHELERDANGEIVVFNQFAEFGNPLFHYAVTGPAMVEVFDALSPSPTTTMDGKDSQHGHNSGFHAQDVNVDQEPLRLAGFFSCTGSAGTIATGDFLRTRHPLVKVGAGEAVQCPTLLYNGYGDHRIEGIGDKHIPWVHNVRNTDMTVGVDDEDCVTLLRLFGTDVGRAHLRDNMGVDETTIAQLSLLGISGIANMLGLIKMARYYEWNADDVGMSVATDAANMYNSRLAEMTAERGEFSASDAAVAAAALQRTNTEHMQELSHRDRKRIHNLKYFTWCEQQGKCPEELDRQWSDRGYWRRVWAQQHDVDARIADFNRRVRE